MCEEQTTINRSMRVKICSIGWARILLGCCQTECLSHIFFSSSICGLFSAAFLSMLNINSILLFNHYHHSIRMNSSEISINKNKIPRTESNICLLQNTNLFTLRQNEKKNNNRTKHDFFSLTD